MKKNDIPVTYRMKNGYLEYRLLTEFLPFWNWRKYAYWGWHSLWMFKAEPINVRDCDSPEHMYLVCDRKGFPETYGGMMKHLAKLDEAELRKFDNYEGTDSH